MIRVFASRLREFYRRQFIQDVAVLQFGTFTGNILQALAGIVIARFLQPENYGIYALSFGLASVLSILLGVGVQEGVTTVVSGAYARKDGQEIRDALAFLLKITFWASAITLVITAFAPGIAGHFYHNRAIGYYAAIIILGVIVSGTFDAIATLTLQVVNQIKKMTALILVDQVARFALAVVFVMLGFGIWGAVSGQLVGTILVCFLAIFFWGWIRKNEPLFPSLNSLLAHSQRIPFKKYFGFSFWVALDRNIGNLYAVLPVLIVGLYVTTTEVTFFKLSFAYINLAMSLLGPISTLLNVKFPKILVESDYKELYRNYISVSLYSLLFSFVLTIGAIAVSPLAFRVMYGANFLTSIRYVYGLVIYGSFMGIGVALGPMWRAVNKIKVSIVINVITLGIGIPMGMFMIQKYGLWGAVAMVTIWYTVSHVVSFIYLAKALKLQAQISN